MIERGIRQDNTWLVVDPVVGCAHDCQYCFLRIYNRTRHPGVVTMSPSEAVDRLAKYWAFKATSNVMIGSESDMLMNAANQSFLRRFIESYDSASIQNPLCLCTKSHVPDDFLAFLRTLKTTRIVFYVSYSGLPVDIEPYIDKSETVANFRRLFSIGLPVIHLLRPMLPHNSTCDVLKRVLNDVRRYASCTVVRGLNLNAKLQKLVWFWPEARDAKIDFTKYVSTWPAALLPNLRRVMAEFADYPVFFDNPCALAYVFGKPDLVGMYGSERCQTAWCPANQRRLCKHDRETRSWPTPSDVQRELSSIGLPQLDDISAADGAIRIGHILNHEQTACLAQVLRCNVKPEGVHSEHEWGGYIIGHDDVRL